ncbi:MAG: DUF1080 domain-containing protein [Bacteroidota bacterium]
MKLFITLTVFAIVLNACGNKEKKEITQQELSAPTAQLTEEQIANGWRLLFDGQTTKGWQIFKGRENNTWEVDEGTLHCKPLKEGVAGDGDQRSDIMTTEEFENFKLTFDWKITPEANSGVMFRVTEEFEQPYYSGPEYQVVDDKGYPGELNDTQLTAATFDMYGTVNQSVRPIGEWNTSKLVVNDNHVEHWLNGSKVLEYELGSADWIKRKNECKWKDAVGYGMAKKGHIDIQDHGSEVWYKNIMIRIL